MSVVVQILQVMSLSSFVVALSVLLISLWSFIRPVYIIDRMGNWHRGLIRRAQNVPNNGMLYRCLYNRRDEITSEERVEWIENNRELYYDIQNQMNSRPPYDKVKVRVR